MPHAITVPSPRTTLRLWIWILCAASVPVLILTGISPVGWDLHVYANAIRSLRLGHDPYLDGIAVQRAFHTSPQAHIPGLVPPYTYVYSPLTLPLLGALARLPLALTGTLYWILYTLGLLAMVWAGGQSATPSERPFFAFLAPIAAFFPGLLQANVLLSGNLVYPLYGVVLLAALLGWRRQLWLPFYLAVLASSCFKAPLLTLLLIPVLTARRQWIPAILAATLGFALFAIQPLLWPSTFHNYLEAVSLQFRFNNDFGLSPSGLFANLLAHLGLPYSAPSLLLYSLYAAAILATLLALSKRYKNGHLSLEHWTPVMLLGVILLNPRIKEYDLAPLTLPLALIAWRLYAASLARRNAILAASLSFLALNVLASLSSLLWRLTAGLLLVALFLAGSIQLVRLRPSPTAL